MSIRVTPDQFVISPEGIRHMPTGARLMVDPAAPSGVTLDMGLVGAEIDHSEEHRPGEIEAMLRQLWAEYVARGAV